MNWSSRPFVRLFIPLVSGILLAYHVPVFREAVAFWFLFPLAFFLIAAYSLHRYNRSWKWRWVNGLFITAAVVIAGVFLTLMKLEPGNNVLLNTGEGKYVAVVVSEPVQTEKSVKMVLRLERSISDDTSSTGRMKVMAFFQKDSLSRKLEYGDILAFKARLISPEAPKNPGEFDYASFLALNNVYAMAFIRQSNWSLLGSEQKSLYATAAKARKYLLCALRKNGVAGDDYKVAAAVLLGYDQILDPELEQNYVTAGAMHILCVSGLHVGIIFLVLNFMLGFLRRNKVQKLIKVFLLLFLIWFYALLTGLSPSVLRASVMISLFIIATLFERYKDVYNTLAASAVLLLLFNPLLIFNVGFQLSYTAVLGILLFYNPVYGIFYLRNKVADKIWSIVAVSAAAQLGTFPLAAHYFHFFPPYFWLTNIFIFPLSFAIIGTGMAFMVFSWVPVASHVLGTILSGFVYILNLVVGMVKFLPYNGIHDLYFPWVKVIIVYALILSSIPLLLNRRIKMMVPALSFVLLLLLFNTYHKYEIHKQARMVVYSVAGHCAYDFIRGKEHVLLVDSVVKAKPGVLDFQLENSRIGWGLDKKTFAVANEIKNVLPGLYYDGRFGIFGPYRFMVWREKNLYPANQTIDLDFVIISGRKKADLQKLQKLVSFDSLIIDSSVPYWKSKSLKAQAEGLGISYMDVREQGAFIVEVSPFP